MGSKIKCFKIIIVTVLLTTPLCVSRGTAPALIVIKNRCITYSESAITFNPPTTEINGREDTLSRYYSPITKYNQSLNCKIEEGEACSVDYMSTYWKLRNSGNDEINEEITDRRWEEFMIYESYYLEEDETTLAYRKAPIRIAKDDFVIPLSLRLKNEGHIYLCENDVTNSRCYWIMLQAWNGLASAIRRCETNYVPNMNKQWAKGDCKILRDSFNHTENIISDAFWAHFQIIKYKGTIMVKRGDEELLKFKDEQPLSVRHIFYHSKTYYGLWKFHQYTYLYIDREDGSSQLGPVFKGVNCLAFFVVMCGECELNIIMLDDAGEELYNHYIATRNEKWKEVKINFMTKKDQSVRMYASTIFRGSRRPSAKMFWAVDSIRHCGNEEYRVLSSSVDNAPCQLVASDTILTVDKADVVSDLDADCPEHTFGENCLPCITLEDYFCRPFKYCELINGQKSCHCTSGFRSKSCNIACPQKYYGHGCKKQCKYCRDGCYNINGNCIGGHCIKDYKGTKCDEPPAPLLKYAPGVASIQSTSCVFYINNTEIIGDTYSVIYFRFEYKKNTDINWIACAEKTFTESAPPIQYINNLEADTTYCVRGVLYSNALHIYNGNAIEEECFNTTCTLYDIGHIDITPYNESATVKLSEISKDMCRLANYRYSVDAEPEKIMEKTVELNRLKPSQRYTFNLRHVVYGIISKPFWTKEGKPSKVERLMRTYSSSNKISVKWEEPVQPNGKVTYNVKYRLLRKKNCNVSTSIYRFNVSSTEVSLLDLKPYSVYEIRVCAQTSEARGKYVSIEIETNSSDTLASSEQTLINTINPSANDVTINFKRVKCEDVEGPIYLKFLAKCLDPWCKSEIHNNVTVKYNVGMISYTVGNLSSYTRYTLTMAASRNMMDWYRRQYDDFTTKSSVPNKINAIGVTSKDEKSISLRWKPPFPPTGILRQYKITYTDHELETNITQCKLWRDYHCSTISKDLNEDTEYTIEIYARNEGHSEYSKISRTPLRVATETDVPDSPYDVLGTWTDKNDLNISWNHPNATNGKIKNFTVTIANGKNKPILFLKEVKSEEDYNLTYSYLIEKKNFEPCMQYDVSVAIYNENYSNKTNAFKEWSPPSVPDISDSAIQITNDTNQNVFITISKLMDEDKNLQSENRYYILTSSSRDEENDGVDLKNFEMALKNDSELILKNINKFHNGSQEDITDTKTISINSTEHGKIYRLYLYFVNKCHGKIELKMLKRNPFSLEPANSNKALYALILLIFLIPLALYVYIYKIKKKQTAEGSILSAIKPQRKKDIEEVPLSENEPVKVGAIRSSQKQKIMLHVPTLKTKFSKPIKIIDFEMYVKRAIEIGELEKQHENFPRGQTKPWDYGALKVNKTKNRYNNLIAYDHTRVKLAKISGVEYSDYINANYIDGYRIPKAYIATQGPKAATLNDFWRMVWQEKVKYIVMLANINEGGKKKVEKYWPSINEETDFNGIRVQYVSSKVYANYEHRVFKVYNKNEEGEVNQLHFTSWPDHGVPLYSQSLVPFLQQMLKIPNNSQSPVVVHCSAGVGRTGTIILCDICLRMAAGEGSIDFLANLEHLRSQRANMVDNVEQYKLAHLVVLECLFGMHTAIPCDDGMNKAIEKILNGDGIANQLRYLSDTEWEDRAMDTVWNKKDVVAYPEKNRFKDILPDKNYQICLKYYPQNDESSSYINAVQVDGFRSPGRFLVSQQPLPNTIGDFWRMVWERQCTIIISLNEIDSNDKSSCNFWPEKGPDMTPVDYFRVSYVNTKALEAYRIVTVEVVNRKEDEKMEINIIAMHNWMHNELLPNSIENFLLFWEECDILSRKCDSIIVTCYDGATASGLYIATTFLIDKIKLEQECDVCLAVRTIRHNRKEFVTSEEQFTFLYRIALMYIQTFQSYANFA